MEKNKLYKHVNENFEITVEKMFSPIAEIGTEKLNIMDAIVCPGFSLSP